MSDSDGTSLVNELRLAMKNEEHPIIPR